MKSKKRQPNANGVSQGFWNWFVEVSPQIETALDLGDCTAFVSLISSKVKDYAPTLGWEIGPGFNKPYAFSFTLNGDLKNLRKATQAVKSAPQLPKWEFNASRPPKKWSGEFAMTNRFGDSVNVNSGRWKYLLTGFNSNEFFDIELLTDLQNMNEAGKLEAVTIALQGYLGELDFLQKIGEIKLPEKLDSERLDDVTELLYLPLHLKSLGGRHRQ